MPTNHNNNSSNSSNVQLGKRVDNLDSEVKQLGKQVGLISADIVGLNSTVHALSVGQTSQSNKLDLLLERGGASEATKDMIPAKYVTWGIGAFISLIAVSMTGLGLAAAVVLYAINNNSIIDDIKDSQLKASIAKVETITQSKFDAMDIKQTMDLENLHAVSEIGDNHVRKDIKDIESDIEDLEGAVKDFRDTYYLPLEERVRYIENTRSESGDISDIKDRIAELEVSSARNDERVTKTWDEIRDHEDEADHPIKQEFQIKALQDRIDGADHHKTK